MLALPLSVVAAYNALAGRPWWTLALPGLMVFFLAVELLLDDILKIEFRQGRLLVPYLLLLTLATSALALRRFRRDRLLGL